MKNYALLCDLRIIEEFCNSKCEYCEGYYHTPYSRVKLVKGMIMPEEWSKKRNINSNVESTLPRNPSLIDFFSLAEKVIKKINESFSVDILKISGGEITLFDGLTDFIDSIHANYKAIQILTNGVILSDDSIRRYKEMGNITFQISIDGYDLISNYSRTHQESVTKKVLSNIDKIASSGMGIELNTVLTKYNTDKFENFLNYLSKYENLIVFPRPVRGEPQKELKSSKNQITVFEDVVIHDYKRFSKNLPPLAYLQRVVDSLQGKITNNRCYVPNVIISCDNYGTIEKCPIVNEPANANCNVLGNYILNTSQINKVRHCQNCLTQYDIFNLYMNNIISEDDLRKIPSLKFKDIINNLGKMKEAIEFE